MAPIPLFRHRLKHYNHSSTATVFASLRRAICSSISSSSEKRELSKLFSETDDTDHLQWKENKNKIIRDISHTRITAKDIIQSHRYKDGERLTVDDENFVLEKLLAYHPNSVDKIGCGLDSIMVDRHPQFTQSRCLHVVRTDGGWADFSYKKCLQEYIRKKYPAFAERFIQEYFEQRNIQSARERN